MIISYQKFLSESNVTYTEKDPEFYKIFNYEWDNGFLNCYQHVFLLSLELTKLPFKFGIIEGIFNCSGNDLTNLEGCPHTVNDSFFCADNKLTNLEHCPKYVSGRFSVFNNNPLSLSIEDYPRCVINGRIDDVIHYYNRIYRLVKDNVKIFQPLLHDKVRFHQQIMRMDPELIPYYTTIKPPSKKSIL